MKLNSVDLIATTAISLGTAQMLIYGVEIFKTDDISSYNTPSLFIGLAASFMWTLYQIKKDGMNKSVIYSGFGLLINLYILHRLFQSGFPRKRRNTTSTKKNNK